MRPQEAIRIINGAFKPFYSINSIDPILLNRFKNPKVIRALKDMEKRQEEDCDAYYSKLTSIEDIMDQFHYISDRWNDCGRIRFILRVISEL